MRKVGLLELGRDIVDLPQSITVLGDNRREICQGCRVGLLECKELSLGITLDDRLRDFGWRRGG